MPGRVLRELTRRYLAAAPRLGLLAVLGGAEGAAEGGAEGAELAPKGQAPAPLQAGGCLLRAACKRLRGAAASGGTLTRTGGLADSRGTCLGFYGAGDEATAAMHQQCSLVGAGILTDSLLSVPTGRASCLRPLCFGPRPAVPSVPV